MNTKKIKKDDINSYLRCLEQDIEAFIKNSIELSSEVTGWSKLHDQFSPLRCWKIKGCKKVNCLAYNNADYRCWLRAGTMCGSEVQGDFAKKYKTCFKCEVFSLMADEPARALYERIDILIYHLQNLAVKSRELAIKDPLTDLYNRHFFNEIIERELASTKRRFENLSFIMIDLDNFKKINDTLGHLAGDKILVAAAKLIKTTVRKSDLVFRFGGDEFLILMLNTDCEKKELIVERLIDEVNNWNKENADGYGCKLSFSSGCSTCEKECDVHFALQEADEKMYKDKIEKKNKAKIET